nr:MAG TPA: hypothetical protein [Caudoviricetes sp.]
MVIVSLMIYVKIITGVKQRKLPKVSALFHWMF